MAQLHILYGLPGSGKSFLAKQIYFSEKSSNYRDRMVLVDLDKKSIDSVKDYKHYNYSFILDGLVHTNDQLDKLCEKFFKLIDSSPDKYYSHVHYFKEDRERCLHNDLMRGRPVLADISIRKLPYEIPSDEILTKWKLKLISREVHFVTYKDKFIEWFQNDVYNPGKLISRDWTLGGTHYNCWGNEWRISAQPETSFIELEELLCKVCPKLTFLEFLKIERECVSKEDFYFSDYYINETRARWVCDLSKLYDSLDKMGFPIGEYNYETEVDSDS